MCIPWEGLVRHPTGRAAPTCLIILEEKDLKIGDGRGNVKALNCSSQPGSASPPGAGKRSGGQRQLGHRVRGLTPRGLSGNGSQAQFCWGGGWPRCHFPSWLPLVPAVEGERAQWRLWRQQDPLAGAGVQGWCRTPRAAPLGNELACQFSSSDVPQELGTKGQTDHLSSSASSSVSGHHWQHGTQGDTGKTPSKRNHGPPRVTAVPASLPMLAPWQGTLTHCPLGALVCWSPVPDHTTTCTLRSTAHSKAPGGFPAAPRYKPEPVQGFQGSKDAALCPWGIPGHPLGDAQPMPLGYSPGMALSPGL